MKKKVTFVIDEEIARRLKIASAVHDLNQSAIVEAGVSRELEKLDKRVAKQEARR